MPIERKRGAFSTEELQYLVDNRGILTVEQIAEKLNRTVQVVNKQLEKINEKQQFTVIKQNSEEAKRDLKTRSYWPQIKKEYTPEELLLYIDHWGKYQEQFDNDVTHAEELQICHAIDLNIQMHRNLQEKMTVTKDIEKIRRQIDKETDKPDDAQNKDYINNLMQTLAGLSSAQMTRTKEYKDLFEAHNKLMASLKSTRDQRFSEIQSRKVTFFGWIKAFDDATQRARYSKEAELLSLAADKATKDLSEFHTYADKKLDLPILNSETVNKFDEQPELGQEIEKGEENE